MLKLSLLPFNANALFLPISFLLTAFAVYFLGEHDSVLIYDRLYIDYGEYWRVFTCHFVHTNFNHLLLNSAALVMLWALHGDHYQHKSFAIVALLSAFVCSVGIYYFAPTMERYVGLSGLLHGIFVWGAICDIKKGWKSGYLLFIGVWLKIIWEQNFGGSESAEALINARVAVDAHLWGAIGGLIYPTYQFIKMKLSNNHSTFSE